MPSSSPAPLPGSRRFPQAGVHTQLASAAVMWLVGACILLVRGIGYLHDEHWALQLLALAAILGVLKSRMVLDRVARKAVARIRQRGTAWYFGFFSGKSWGFVAIMMGGGILLRRSGLNHGLLAVLYLAVGSALVLADRIFWSALRSPVAAPQPNDP